MHAWQFQIPRVYGSIRESKGQRLVKEKQVKAKMNTKRTTFANKRSVSKSSRMLLFVVVISTKYRLSSGWYTYRTLSVSTKVCCSSAWISFGKDDSRPSILERDISIKARATTAACVLFINGAARLLKMITLTFARLRDYRNSQEHHNIAACLWNVNQWKTEMAYQTEWWCIGLLLPKK